MADTWAFYRIKCVTESMPPGFFPPNPAEGGTLSDGTPSGENTMATLKRIVAAANSKIWYEE